MFFFSINSHYLFLHAINSNCHCFHLHWEKIIFPILPLKRSNMLLSIHFLKTKSVGMGVKEERASLDQVQSLAGFLYVCWDFVEPQKSEIKDLTPFGQWNILLPRALTHSFDSAQHPGKWQAPADLPISANPDFDFSQDCLFTSHFIYKLRIINEFLRCHWLTFPQCYASVFPLVTNQFLKSMA